MLNSWPVTAPTNRVAKLCLYFLLNLGVVGSDRHELKAKMLKLPRVTWWKGGMGELMKRRYKNSGKCESSQRCNWETRFRGNKGVLISWHECWLRCVGFIQALIDTKQPQISDPGLSSPTFWSEATGLSLHLQTSTLITVLRRRLFGHTLWVNHLMNVTRELISAAKNISRFMDRL